MNPPPVVVDTNILVSGLITENHLSPPCVIVDGMLRADFPFLLSVELLKEYRQVLLRPKIQNLHKLSTVGIDTILEDLAANAIFREQVAVNSQAPDENDQHLWMLLATTKQAILITGDQLLLNNPPGFARVISANSFLSMINFGK
ncbi:MAG TPA: putative toxin-antitoxin system toxin component, PIN family [Gammaproteobacteria bacterium]|nr:putative toxin-antitoxin system toxin component, PIN family [Gammaproteobacteria bacterium]